MKSRGFTLVEMLITLVILGVGLGIAVPSMNAWTNDRRAQAVAQSMIDGLRFARQEALSRNTNINFTLVTETDGTVSWEVGCAQVVNNQNVGTSTALIGCPATIRERKLFENGDRFSVSPSPTSNTIQFQPLGNIATTSITSLAGSGTATALNMIITYRGTATPIAVSVTVGGVIKICKTSISTAGDPLLCLAPVAT
ncbi:GspH/FimT family pseudopilin [Burkholderiaceae bacterium DAT-1]|nr:GspH/FimT family pseudopilin [Burkholderiaceae bacterium DAT-1]